MMSAGFEMVETEALIGSFARHLMTGFDHWDERGFNPIADAYLARLSKKAAERGGASIATAIS